MAVVNIAALLICLFYFSYIWKKTLVEMFPVIICMLVFALYALALIRKLNWIDGIGLVIIMLFIVWLLTNKPDKRVKFFKECLQNMTQVSFIVAFILILCVIFCTSHKVVSWWDDINFWAADVKSLYYLNGFASKYGNVSPEFGDYPPGGQLFKWWFLHLDTLNFREGLAFAGYYVMNIAFMLPLLKHFRRKNIIITVLAAVSLWFLPSIAEAYGYDGFCADLTLACIYGGFLFAVTEENNGSENTGRAENFYYVRLALYLGVLVLIKSVGFIWAAFGLIFFFAYRMAGENSKTGRTRLLLKSLSVAAAPFLMGGSWMLFCLIMHRVTNTTATAVKYITTDDYGLSGYMGDYARAFGKAFAGLPLHQEKSALINLTPLAFYICICLIVVFFYRKGLMPKKQGRIVLCFNIISGAVFYGMIFLAHITIFANETQYLEAFGMISSIERYGAPFTIGTLIFLSNIWIKYGECKFGKKAYVLFLLFVALTAGYKTAYHGLIGYHSEIDEQLQVREDMLDDDARTFLEAVKTIEVGSGTRVCYIQRDDEPRWVRNSYTSLEASPVSVVYKSVNLDDAPTDWMEQEIRASHAFYLYVESTTADTVEVFGRMMQDADFSCEKIYKIEDDGIKLRLLELP